MAVKTVQVMGNLAASTSRGPSEAIWANCLVPLIREDPSNGMLFFDDFLMSGPTPATGSALPWGQWAAYCTTGGVISDFGLEGGVAQLYGTTTAHQGVGLGALTNAFRLAVPSTYALTQKLWFEARVGVSTAALAASKADMFVGLFGAVPAANVPITSTGGALATTAGLIGFHIQGGATQAVNGTAAGYGDWSFVYQVSGGTAVYPINLAALITAVTGSAPVGATNTNGVAAGLYKLGFVYDPGAYTKRISLVGSSAQTVGNLAKPLITVYVNGLPAAAFIVPGDVGSTFPTTFMGPSVAFMQQSTTASVYGYCDWIRVAQNANT